MSRNRRLYNAIGFGTISRIVALVLAVVQVPLVVSHLGKEAYGLWILCSSVAGWVVLSDLGLSNGLLNLLSRCYATDQKSEANRVYSSCIAMLLAIAISLSIIFIALMFIPFEDIFQLKHEKLKSDARLSVYLAFILPLWTLVIEGMNKPYLAYQEGRVTSLWQITGGIVSFAFIIAAIQLDGGVPFILAASFMGHFLCRFASWIQLIAFRHPHLRPKLSAISIVRAKGLFQTGSKFLVTSIAWLLIVNIDQFIIGSFLGAEQNASYGLVMKILGYALVIPNLLHVCLWPAYVEAAESGNYSWIRKSLVRALILAVGGTGLVLFTFSIFGDQLIYLWTNKVVVVESSLLVWMIALGMVFAAISQATALLNALEKFSVLIPAVVTAGVLNIILSLILVRFYNVQGVMIATICSLLVQFMMLLPETIKILSSRKIN